MFFHYGVFEIDKSVLILLELSINKLAAESVHFSKSSPLKSRREEHINIASSSFFLKFSRFPKGFSFI